MLLAAIVLGLLAPQMRYEVNGQFVEVLGVGRMREGTFEGWSPSGSSDPALTKMVNSAMAKLRPEQGLMRLVPGKKNRFLVLRVGTTSPERPNLFINGTATVLEFHQDTVLRTKEIYDGVGRWSREEIKLKAVSVDPTVQDLKLSVVESDWLDPGLTMPAQVGARCSVRNAEFQLTSITKDKDERYGPQWHYRFTVLKSDDLVVSLIPIARKGSTFERTTRNGRPEKERRYAPYNPVPPKGQDPRSPMVPQGIFLAGGPGPPMVVFSVRELGVVHQNLAVDPKYVQSFAGSASWSKVAPLGTVSLEPSEHAGTPHQELFKPW